MMHFTRTFYPVSVPLPMSARPVPHSCVACPSSQHMHETRVLEAAQRFHIRLRCLTPKTMSLILLTVTCTPVLTSQPPPSTHNSKWPPFESCFKPRNCKTRPKQEPNNSV